MLWLPRGPLWHTVVFALWCSCVHIGGICSCRKSHSGLPRTRLSFRALPSCRKEVSVSGQRAGPCWRQLLRAGVLLNLMAPFLT